MRIEVAEQFTQDCHDLGIAIHGTFIVGLPGETRETLEKTKAWACKINPHTIQVSLAAPYPGTSFTIKRWRTAGSTPPTPSWSMTRACKSRRCITRT
jgi:tRNA A37 methylthiotransferase MiaB